MTATLTRIRRRSDATRPAHIRHGRFAALFIIAAALHTSCSPASAAQILNVAEQNNKLFIAGGGVTIRYDLFSGRFDIFRANAELIIKQGYSTAEISDKPEGGGATRTLSMSGKDKLNWFMEQVSGPLGAGTKITAQRRLPEQGVVLKDYISFYDNQPGVFLQSGVKNISGSAAYISRLTPAQAQAPDGGLFIGLNPANVKSLATYFFCRDNSGLLKDASGAGATCSDEAGAYYDAPSDRGLVAGFITQAAAASTVSSAYDPARAAREPDSERLGFTLFRTSCRYAPSPALTPGQAMESETLAILPSWGPPSQELEIYGKLIGALNSSDHRRPPPILSYGECCAPDNKPTASAAAQALDSALAKLGAPGEIIFKLGPGWSKSIGDWSPSDGFPDGMKTFADAVRSRKIKPGITIAPFAVEHGSKIAKEHPDWLLDGPQPALPSAGPALIRLDTSKPGVQSMVFTLVRRAAREWGFDYIEIDMAGFTTPPRMFLNRGSTAQEALVKFIKLIRDAAGPAAIIGVVNSEPTSVLPGVDVASVAFAAGDAAENKSISYERYYSFGNMTRMYYLNGRARANNAGPAPTGARPGDEAIDPSVWLAEAALYGGALEARIWDAPQDEKIFERFKRLLPLYPKGATPIDIFENGLGNGFFGQSPSRKLNLRVTAEWGKWNVIGLFHILPERPQAPQPDDVTVKFSDLGLSPAAKHLLYDFWTDSYIGEATGSFSVQAPLMSMKIIGAREALPRPQLLNSNRHYTMGGVEVPSLSWNESDGVLSGTLIADAGFHHRLAFRSPPPYEFLSAEVEGNPGAATNPADGHQDVIYLSFTPAASGPVKWSLNFKKNASE